MANHKDIATRWADRATGKTDKPALGAGASRGNVYERDGRIYSYGSHFEMGRYVKPAKSEGFFLLNGDTYSVTTSRHQSHVRDAVHAMGAPFVIVPHTAMDRAGIVLDSVRVIDSEPERNETTDHRVTLPGLVDLGRQAAAGDFGWDRSGNDADKERGTYSLSITRKLKHEDATYSVQVFKRGYDYGVSAFADYDSPKVSYYRNGSGLKNIEGDLFMYQTFRHFLGGCVFVANVQYLVTRECQDHHAVDGGIWCDSCGGHVERLVVSGEVKPYLVRETKTRRAWFVSGWDENETHPLYFLAELPARAWQLTPTDAGWEWAKSANRPKTYADALESLAPKDVKLAKTQGVEVIRQGDIFAVPCGIETGPPVIAAKYAERSAAVPLDGTSRHIVSELVVCADGGQERVYARGTMRHTEGDHKRVKLDGWHRLYRNTVPMQDVPASSHATHWQTVRAWTIAGRVD